MDKETTNILSEQKQITKLTETEGWDKARAKLVDKIMDLQNAFNINSKDPQSMYIDLEARKLATNILFEWLQDVEGTKEQYESNKLTLNTKSYIVRKDLEN